jgi:hypothetical protein
MSEEAASAVAGGPSQPAPPSKVVEDGVRRAISDDQLFQDLLDNHWRKIFPNGGRNVGGPQFFKYIYENLATTHDLFQRYNRFYCGVSGSIVSPKRSNSYDVVKVKDVAGQCVFGRYHRCCWPCSCDLMKYARAEKVRITFESDPVQKTREYVVLTIGDPCHRCEVLPCPDLPPEVTTYQCFRGVTENGLRVKDGRVTTEAGGRLIFALLEQPAGSEAPMTSVEPQLMSMCERRITATPDELDKMGGMGNIFVNVARINPGETYENNMTDLCE